MGIVNVTPDSFSDGGRYLACDAAVALGLELAGQGADILDIGGESTRPGSATVPEAEEIDRVIPVIEALARRTSVPLSIDTSKSNVAQASLQAGARIVNDVTGLTGDPAMMATVRDFGAGVIVMHMQGTPATMQVNPHYTDVVDEISSFFDAQVALRAPPELRTNRSRWIRGSGSARRRRITEKSWRACRNSNDSGDRFASACRARDLSTISLEPIARSIGAWRDGLGSCASRWRAVRFRLFASTTWKKLATPSLPLKS